MQKALSRQQLTSTGTPELDLSVAQTDVWRAQRLASGDTLYNIGGYVEVFGALNRGAFHAAILRALGEADSQLYTFLDTPDGPRQVHTSVSSVDIPYVDLRDREDPVATATAWMYAEMERPFDLAAGPAYRFALLQVGPERNLWFGAFHHLVTDLFGTSLFMSRTAELYTSAIENTVPAPAELTPWCAVLQDEREYYSSNRCERDRVYWREQLQNLPEAVTLSGRAPGWPGASVGSVGSVPRAMVSRLEALGGTVKASLPAVLFAAVASYLSRMTGKRDLVLGMPVTGRTNARLRRSAGFVANVVPLRLNVELTKSFAEVVEETGKRIREAYRHQRYGSGAIRNDLGLTASDANAYGVVLNFVPNDAEFNFAGHTVRLNIFTHSRRVEDLYITFHARSDGSDVVLQLDGNAAHYDQQSIDLHRRNFLTLLQAAVEQPRIASRLLPLLDDASRARVLGHWAGQKSAVEPRTFVELFESQVDETPDAIALVSGALGTTAVASGPHGATAALGEATAPGGDRSLTYRQLDERANAVARRLMEQGVGAERIVGLWADRSMEMVIGLLGILKAGGAYLPLDPTYPAERLRLMLEDAQPVLLLGSTEFASQLPRLAIDSSTEAKRLARPIRVNAPAYVIYTSGSTGTPKGVVVTHAGLNALVSAQVDRLRVTRHSRVLQFATLSFDASVSEVLMALTTGAALVLTPAESMSGESLRRLLVEQRITHATLPPAVLPTLKKAADLTLEGLIVAGEACPPALIAQWSPGLRFINAYGPTESTVCATMSAPLQGGGAAPIGTPINGTRVYVLDSALEPVPVGVPGELYISGVGLARGYLKRPSLTASRFVADPYGEPGSRMYRSGDLARWREDGSLEYLGRIDQQVKVRGHRIELGEIEAALTAHPGIEQAAVVVREEEGTGQALVAYIVARAQPPHPATAVANSPSDPATSGRLGPSGAIGAASGPPASADEPEAPAPSIAMADLRRALAARLPPYMIPSRYVALTELPLTPSGKLDRRALPSIDHGSALRATYEAPEGPAETALAQMWAKLLRLERVGRHENFFEMGGNSLLLVQFIDELAQRSWRIEARALFNQPTVAALATAIQTAKPQSHSHAPLIALNQEQRERIAAHVIGGEGNIQDIYPLVSLQEGMLVHHRTSRRDAYILRALLSIETEERLEQFLRALQFTIERHDALRTAVQWEGLPEPVQVVWRSAHLPVTRLSATGAEELWELGLSPIDVTQAPMLRVHVAAEGAGTGRRWLLLLQCHHLVLDHNSLELLMAEVGAHAAGHADSLPPPVPFRNLVAQARAEAAPEEDEAYFRRMLQDIDESTAPFGIVDVRGDGSAIEECRLELPSGLASRVREQARRFGVATSSLFHLGWAMLVARTSARDDVVFGTVLSGRMSRGVDAHRAFGLYINTLPLRLSLAGRSAAVALRETHERLSELLRHENASLTRVQGLSSVPSGTPLFSTLFNYRHDANRVSSADQVELMPEVRLLRGEERTNYPLNISVDDLGSGFNLTAQAARQVGAGRACRFMLTAIESLAQALEEDDATDLRLLQVLPSDERMTVASWARSQAAAPRPRTFVELFESQVDETPDAIALVSGPRGATVALGEATAPGGDRSLTYRQLDERANAVARRLMEQGVGAERVVGLWADRSMEMVIGLLGILKAGGAYLPLDPTYPAERLRLMLEDAQPVLLLGSQEFESLLPRLAIDLGTQAKRLARPIRVNAPAYVIYTSGSTGTPKGVVVTHAGLSAFVLAQVDRLKVTRHSRVLQFATLSFDASVFEVLMALTTGAALVLTPTESMSGEPLRKLLVEQRITHTLLPPAVLPTIRKTEDLVLESLIVGGEACPPALIAQWSPGLRFINAYGPTESTVCATMSAPLQGGGAAPIGTPINGTRVYVLDSALEPVPVGVPGELYISGVGLARGYLKRPSLTASRFVADPYGEPGSRMYRSGDLARWREDGSLEYLGRIDQQVKVRGHRIELGEIEAALTAHPGIEQAAVVVREEEGTGQALVAYIVARAQPPHPATAVANSPSDPATSGRLGPSGAIGAASGPPASADEPEAPAPSIAMADLRRALAARLPPYMIPSRYVALTELPLTPSGKLDRRALPAPEGVFYQDANYEAPDSPTQVRLAAIWQDVLRLERVGKRDDFFASGGHSLLALQVVARVRDVFRLELPLKTLFDAPTLEALSAQIDVMLANGGAQDSAEIVPLNWDGRPAPLSYSQERMWLIQTLNPANTAYNMGAALRVRGDADMAVLSAAYDELCRRHAILRSRVRMKDERPQVWIEPFIAGSLIVEDLSGQPDADSAALERVNTDLRRVFDLSAESVIRARLIKVASDSYVLGIVLHHIAGDQWSMGLFGRELALLYNQHRSAGSATLEPLPVSYMDYAHWQRSSSSQSQFATQLAFWKGKLANLPTVDLPTDLTRPTVWTMNGSSYQRAIPPQLFADLGTLARDAGSTLFMTLFAGFASLLQRISGQTDLPIGVPVANRTHSAIEGLMGTFVNTIVLRADLQGDPEFRELLARVRATALDAFANQDVSFDRLVQEIGQRGDRSRAPLVQVLFNVTNAPMRDIALSGLTWEPVLLDRGGAQFELSFGVDTEITRTVTVEFNTDLFERSTVERLVGQYFTILEAAVAAPEIRISRLPTLPAEQWASLQAWNATTVAWPSDPFPRVFEAQAARTPDNVAVSFEGGSLSYAELNSRANALARTLVTASTVGVCMQRSPQLLISLLAVQKAGATYIPLDPEFPAERLAYMLSDSGATALLTSGLLPQGLEVPAGIDVIDVTATRGQSGNLPHAPAPQDAAYILYTSGSTGKPKGVVVPHRALANFLNSMRERPGLSASDVLAAVTTVSFDIAGLELYLPLVVGARIELVPKQVATDGTELGQLLQTSGATVLQATPATWRMLIESGWQGGGRIRALCGGEAVSRSLANDILERVGELWNMYGPTETTIWSTVERIERDGAAISIGRPIANTQVYILDAAGEVAPIGVTGEICIGGTGVATGYHRRPALTAERFTPDPHAADGTRLYRTGDLGRWGADGKLYHLGRSDTQVKIRGFRIELGEIEKALSAHQAIQHAVAAVREAGPDDPRLVAYVTGREGGEVTITDLKRFLRNQLPDYMIPSIIVTLVSMPLTPNGKVDRNALPDPFDNQPMEPVVEELPATAMERVLADAWKAVLKVDRVRAADNFFELGGYSLLSLRVARMIEKQTGRKLDPRTLFFHNLRDVAKILDPADPSA